MVEIINVRDFTGGIARAVDYIYGIWGSNKSYDYYLDAIKHSSLPDKALPRFYLLLKDEKPVGCYALITNDFVSRHDLFPWFACLYIEEKERGNKLGKLLMEHADKEAKEAGFSNLYLTTEHEGYYEKYGWRRIDDGFEIDGSKTRIYEKSL